MRRARIKRGKIENVAVFDTDPGRGSEWVAVPDDAGIGWSDDGGGRFSPPAQVVREMTARQERKKNLSELLHDLGDGRTIKVRPEDIPRIRDTIEAMEEGSGRATVGWVMSDGAKHPTTLDELKSALKAGLMASLDIWDNYEPEDKR